MKRLALLLGFLAGCGTSSVDSPSKPASGANVYFLDFEGQA